ncbi:MAG: LysR substrate-binding domain-containing protein [Azospirillaceae bacterium]|nr:LysR substrate-binding domain-containing protein [Azospirillaceae bacterium]
MPWSRCARSRPSATRWWPPPPSSRNTGQPAKAKDLQNLPCVTQSEDQHWDLTEDGKTVRVKGQIAFASNTYLVLSKAVKSGLGVGLIPFHMVEKDLSDGSLVAVLPNESIPERPFYAAFAPGDATPEKVRVFVKFLVQWFRTHPLD